MTNQWMSPLGAVNPQVRCYERRLGLVARLFGIALGLLALAPAAAQEQAIASAHPLATKAGFEVLEAGGNAFDAAIAVTAALAVVEPYSSGLGGGGFWLLHRAQDDYQTMLDGRERAPLAAQRDLYLDEQGQVRAGLSIDGPLAAGVPGTPAALQHLTDHYATLSLADNLAPAIRLANRGFAVGAHYQRMARFRLEALRASPDAARIFLQAGAIPELGTMVQQPELAKVLEHLAKQGARAFYEGEIAQQLVRGVRAAGGIWTLRDFREYRVVERKPVRGRYQGVQIITAAPPSSGGVALISMLNILGGYSLEEFSSTTRKHLMIEAMRRAYRDRAEYLGDPDFVDVPMERLLHPYYAAGLRAGISLHTATPSGALAGYGAATPKASNTTHFSILDREGNRVAATLSINYPFGSGFVPPGTGILLNDEMDDFSIRPGTPNVYGLVGAEANAIAPGKRMLSSMSPTFLESERGVAILGTPGGSRIITMMLQAVLEFTQGTGPQDWVNRPRFHHQYLPDQVQYEVGAFTDSEMAGLRRLGHTLVPLEGDYGNMQAIFWERDNAAVVAASDPRGVGHAEVR